MEYLKQEFNYQDRNDINCCYNCYFYKLINDNDGLNRKCSRMNYESVSPIGLCNEYLNEKSV